LFGGDFFFIRGCRKYECTRKVNRACFYCLLGLEIIGHFNKVLCIRPPLHMFTRFRGTRWLTLTVRFHLKNVFISRLGNVYRYFLWVFKVSGTSWRRFLFTWIKRDWRNRALIWFCLSEFLLEGSASHVPVRQPTCRK